jgi:hypothetical protein
MQMLLKTLVIFLYLFFFLFKEAVTFMERTLELENYFVLPVSEISSPLVT